jgi:phosphoglycolate phosphatase-like HAD superfamily hydrolase
MPSGTWWRSVSPYSGGTVPALHRSSLTARRFEGASLASTAMRALALDLDGVLADTRPLWNDWLEDAARRTHVELDVPDDRIAAAALLDERLGDWRPLLERFAADRGPVYFRPSGDTGALLRRLHAAGTRIGVFTDAPRELADIALAHVGAARRVETVGTLDEVLGALGTDARVVRARAELGDAAALDHSDQGAD